MTKLRRVTSSRLVERILDEPELPILIPSLDARTLVGVVRHVGLEDAAEILSFASAAQLESMFDEELWTSPGAGQDDVFDGARFSLWLEVLLEGGEEQAIEKVARMNEDLLALGLSRLVMVFDMDAMAAEMSERHDDARDAIEKVLESQLWEELEEFRFIARDGRGWDAVVTLLVGLDKDHHALLRRLLARLVAATEQRVEDEGGLYEVLTSSETLEADVAGDREDRREREGFVSPSQAAAFLRLAILATKEQALASKEMDPVERAYRRALPARPARQSVDLTSRPLLRVLAETGLFSAPASGLVLLDPDERPEPNDVSAALSALRAEDPRRYAEQLEALAFLVNTLVAYFGEPRADRTSASHGVLGPCNEGAAYVAERRGLDVATVVREHGMVHLFRIGVAGKGDMPALAAKLTSPAVTGPATAPRARRSPRRDPP